MSQNCIFCKVVAGEISASLIYQDDAITAFRDINPQAPTHILLIPNKHISSLDKASADDQAVLGKLLIKASDLARQENVADNGYRVVINTNDHGGQTVYHIHVHLLAGRPMTWPPG